MIVLSAHVALLLYLSLTLSILIGLWLFQHFFKTKSKIEMTREDFCICEFCHFAFLSDKQEKIAKCPQCSSYHKK